MSASKVPVVAMCLAVIGLVGHAHAQQASTGPPPEIAAQIRALGPVVNVPAVNKLYEPLLARQPTASVKENFEVRPHQAHMVGQLATVQTWQTDVGHQKIDPLLRLQDLETRRAIHRLKSVISEIRQDLQDQQPNHRLIFHHQNGLASFRSVCLTRARCGDRIG
jgi:hypothetical protein